MQAVHPSVPNVNTAQLLPCWAVEGAGEAAVAAGQWVLYLCVLWTDLENPSSLWNYTSGSTGNV